MIEKKVLNIINDKIDIFVLIIISVIAVAIRVAGKDWISSDMACYLVPWYEEIKDNGGFYGLGKLVGNYNVAYQEVIAFLTYLPIKSVYGYKIISGIFDFLIAIIVYIFIDLEGKKCNYLKVLGFGLVLLHPTVFFNSSYWGQCDSIYSFFCISTIICLVKNRNRAAFFLFGIAIAFKLQAVFILPFIIFYYFTKRNFSIIRFIWSILGFVFISVPALINGQSILNLVDIYIKQTSENNNLYLNWPSIWRILTTDDSYAYLDLKKAAILITIGIITLIYYVVIKKNVVMNIVDYLLLAMITVYSCTLFLPAMHERYNYVAVMLGIIIVLFDKRTIPLFILMLLVELNLYGIIFANQINLSILSCINIFIYLGYLFVFFFKNNCMKKDTSER